MGYGLSSSTGALSSMAGTVSLEKPLMASKERILKVAVIIPTMNEPAISKVVDDARQALKHFNAEVIVVDKSVDDTPRKAKKAGAIVVPQEYSGYGNAYMSGFKEVSLDTDIIVMLDGDK